MRVLHRLAPFGKFILLEIRECGAAEIGHRGDT